MVSPDEEHMFAFFPSCDEKPGIGSLWHRGDAIDRWKPTTHWEFPRGSGVIAGQWLGEHRKWVLDSSNTPIRLPPQGPRISTAQAMLVLVTEDHFVHLKYARHLPEFRSLSTSLLHPNVAIESQTAISHRPVTDRACFDASIGHHFSDNTVFIAYRSRNLGFPRNSVESFDFNMDLNFPNPPDSPTDWEMLGEDPQIHICTVDLKLRDELVVLRSTPLPPIKNVPRHVTEMSFMSYPPGPSPEATEPDSSSGSENLFFGVSTLDLKDFNSTPVTSSFALYKFSRISAEAQESSWSYSHHKTLPVDGALVFVTPTVQNGDTSQGVAFFGVLDVAGQQPKPLVRRKETAVGSIKVLNIPDLTDNSRWETSTIWSSIYAHGLPHCGIISPNCKQIWTPSFAIQSSLQLLPQPHQGDSKYLPNSISAPLPPSVHEYYSAHRAASGFALAILSRRTVIDITHILARPDVPIPEVVTTLKQALEIIQSIPTPSQLPYIADLVGTALEIYKLRAQITKSEEDKADLTARWRTAQDVTSLLAYRLAFDAISEGYRYESTAIWASMRMASFTSDLVKRLMKQCVLASTLASSADAAGEDDDPFASSNGSPDEHLQQSVLLHLSHPFTMENLGILLTHIKRFRNFIEVTAPPNADMWRFARGILTDLMDYCPVNLVELESLLETTSEEVRKLDCVFTVHLRGGKVLTY
ncbi:hypothetical protein CC1G_04217 [Coprinopsis cinerea okayama7|uniref:Uncharacterized protein n=1 Tax=Coprinopsis cinerea (strain Okayama-7 / 130 / ATCC MYA-4618 / FGSC 9003) TaxID=240176 RepID=A8NFA7_COPC7|nr:hypothetical protein CC1G_04217 [Coprinopsis cinerea okayama7\|eukprot:XP_001833238.2 hypothetical protein CC1G_04217 [Coprinopsis cinerea okayama7\